MSKLNPNASPCRELRFLLPTSVRWHIKLNKFPMYIYAHTLSSQRRRSRPHTHTHIHTYIRSVYIIRMCIRIVQHTEGHK